MLDWSVKSRCNLTLDVCKWPHCPRAWMITAETSHIASSAHTGDVSALLNPQGIWTPCDEGLGVSACGLRKWLSLAQLFCGLLFSCCFRFSPSLSSSAQRASHATELDHFHYNQQKGVYSFWHLISNTVCTVLERIANYVIPFAFRISHSTLLPKLLWEKLIKQTVFFHLWKM